VATLVDSSVWIDYFNGRPTPQVDILRRLLQTDVVGIGDLMLAEVLQGFTDDDDFRRARDALSECEVHNIVSQEIAVKAAENYRTLRHKGITVRKTIDCLIATYAIENRHRLLHSDHDFDPFEQHLGLQVVHE
jgi:predicted nucleic acid-binding protein